MKKLNKNFQEQRKSVEAMLNMCANNTCVCDYPDTCNCSSPAAGKTMGFSKPLGMCFTISTSL